MVKSITSWQSTAFAPTVWVGVPIDRVLHLNSSMRGPWNHYIRLDGNDSEHLAAMGRRVVIRADI